MQTGTDPRRLAIFDFDGTIADSGPWFLRVLGEVSRQHGIREITEAERESLRDLSNREILSRLGVPVWKLPAIARTMRSLAARDVDQIKPFPWVNGIFDALARQGVAIAVVSSNAEENIRRVLGSDAASRVMHYGTGASLFGKAGKLTAAVKACAASKTGSVSIGDEVRDIDAARSAGIACLAVTWGYASRTALATARPTQIVTAPDEILHWFAEPAAPRDR